MKMLFSHAHLIALLGMSMFFGTQDIRAQSLLILATDSIIAPLNAQVEIPVRLRNCQDMISLQASFHVEDTTVAVMTGVSQFGLTGLGIANFDLKRSANSLTLAWTEPAISPTRLSEDSVIFVIRVQLKGQAGSRTRMLIDDQPTDLLVGYFNGGNLVTDSVIVQGGEIAIELNMSLEPEFELSIFPQPAQVFLQIQHPELQSISHYAIHGLNGEKIMRNTSPYIENYKLKIPLHKLQSGMYILDIQMDGKSYRKLFVKE